MINGKAICVSSLPQRVNYFFFCQIGSIINRVTYFFLLCRAASVTFDSHCFALMGLGIRVSGFGFRVKTTLDKQKQITIYKQITIETNHR